MNAPEKVRQYDRAAQTVGNIVHLEHYNCCIDDQRLAVLFYVVGLGATRDPYLFPGLENIWLNFGRTQVHMPSRAAEDEEAARDGGHRRAEPGGPGDAPRIRRQGDAARRGRQAKVFLCGE